MAYLPFYITTTGASGNVSLPDLGNRTLPNTLTNYDLSQEFQIEELRYSKSLASAIYTDGWVAEDSLGRTINAQASLALTEELLNKAGHVMSTDELPEGVNNLYYSDTLVGNYLNIAPGSTPYLGFDSLTGQLSVKALAITTVEVDAVYTSLALWAAAVYVGSPLPYQEGDVIILTAATGGTKTYINNGGNLGTAADWTQIEAPDLTDSYIRSLFTGGDGLTYSNVTGDFDVNVTNGISIISDSVGLGGLLTQNTVIDGDTLYDLTIQKLVNFTTSGTGLMQIRSTATANNETYITLQESVGFDLNHKNSATSYRRILANDAKFEITTVNGAEGSKIEINPTSVAITADDSTNSSSLSVGLGFTTFSDSIKIGAYATGGLTAGMIQWNGSNFQGYNGSSWVNLDETGDITAVTAGNGLSGGGTSGAVTLDVNVDGTTIQITGDQLSVVPGSITTAYLAINGSPDVGNVGDVLTSDGAGGFDWTTPAVYTNKSWTWGASSQAGSNTDRFLDRHDGTATNQSPFVAWFNCTLTNISLSSNVASTWTAEVYVNGVSAATLASGGNQYATGTANVSINAGDRISFYVNGTNVNRPSIDALFVEA